jgi:hypothetical protein
VVRVRSPGASGGNFRKNLARRKAVDRLNAPLPAAPAGWDVRQVMQYDST